MTDQNPQPPEHRHDEPNQEELQRRRWQILHPGEEESDVERLAREKEEKFSETLREQHPDLVSYVQYLQNPDNIGLITRIIDEQRENITTWTTSGVQDATQFIRENFPGPEAGRNAFADALLSPHEVTTTQEGTSNAPLYEYAWVHLRVLVEHIGNRRRVIEQTSQQRRDLEGSMGSAAETLKTGARNFMDRLRHADMTEKALMIGSAAIILWLLWKQRDKTIGKDGPKWSTVALWAGAAIGLNYLSGKVASDGKTFLNRFLHLGTSAEELPKDSMYFMFAAYLGEEGAEAASRQAIDKGFELTDEREIASLYAIGTKNMRRIHRVWQNDRIHTQEALSMQDLIAIGISPEEVGRRGLLDERNPPRSKTMYRTIAKLYWLVGRNYYEEILDTPSLERRNDDRFQSALQKARNHDFSDLGLLSMSDRYLKPNDPEITYEKVMVDAMIERELDMPGEIEDNIAAWESERLPRQAAEGVRRIAQSIQNTAMDVYHWGYRTGRRFLGFADETLAAGAELAGIEYSSETKKTRDALKNILGANFPFEITEAEESGKGKMRLFGVPVEYRVRKRGNERVIRIEGVVIRQSMSAAEVANAKRQLEQKARQRFQEIIGRSRIPGVGNIPVTRLEWDTARSMWRIPNAMHVSANQRLNVVERDVGLAVRIRTDSPHDNPKVEFFINRSRVLDFSDVQKSFERAQVAEAIYNAFPALSTRVGGQPLDPPVPIDIAKTEELADHSIRIEGKIGGMDFQKTLAPNQTLADLPDLVRNIQIEQPFINAYLEHVAENPDFHKPFNDIYHFLDGVNEGLWERISSMWDTNFLYVFPTNITAGLAGPVRETRTRFILMQKKAEVLFVMGRFMERKTLGNFETAIPAMRRRYDAQLAAANALYIKMRTDYDQAGGGDRGSEVIAQRMDNDYRENGVDRLSYSRELLTIGYTDAYRAEFFKFLHDISDSRFVYFANEADTPVFTSSHEVYVRLISYYFMLTSRQADDPTPDSQILNGARRRIITMLDNTRSDSRLGVITLEGITAHGLTEPLRFQDRREIMGEQIDPVQ